MRRPWATLGIAVVTLGVIACTPPAGPPPATPSPSPVLERLGPPILSEAQAIEAATRSASFSAPEVTGGRNIRNPKARLMTLEEYEDRFASSHSSRDRSVPVWVVSMEGEWRDDGIVPPDKRRTYNYAVLKLDASTGEFIGGSWGFEPVNLDEAQGLDPEAFARYPLEVSLSYGRDVADFPVSEPGFLPDGFSLERVTLELAPPLQAATPYSWLPNQSVVLHYSDGRGHNLQVMASQVGQPDLLPGAESTTVHDSAAWHGKTLDGGTWFGWDTTNLDGTGHLTHILYSPDGSISVDVLQRIAESLPMGELPG